MGEAQRAHHLADRSTLVGTAQERVCPPYDRRAASSALHTKAPDRDFRHRFGMPVNQMAGANVAIERHQLVEESARASSAFGEQRT